MEKAQSITEQIEKLSRGTEGALVRLEHMVHPWVSFVILPLFALANAGIVFTSDTLSEAVNSHVTIGIVSGVAGRKGVWDIRLFVAGGPVGGGAVALDGALGACSRYRVACWHRLHGRHLRVGNCVR